MMVEVFDPCFNTVPSVEAFRLLSAPRLDIDAAFVSGDFTDSVDVQTSAYGTGKCGPVQIEIYDAQTDFPVDFILYYPDQRVFSLEPGSETPLGLRDYYYVARMVNYSSRTNVQPFQAEVTACVVTNIFSN